MNRPIGLHFAVQPVTVRIIWQKAVRLTAICFNVSCGIPTGNMD